MGLWVSGPDCTCLNYHGLHAPLTFQAGFSIGWQTGSCHVATQGYLQGFPHCGLDRGDSSLALPSCCSDCSLCRPLPCRCWAVLLSSLTSAATTFWIT